MKINIISADNGVGLSRDMRILNDAFTSLGFDVIMHDWRRHGLRKAHINVFCEVIEPRLMGAADKNIFIPNPEWFYSRWNNYLSGFDMILAKTRQTEEVFKPLHRNVMYTSFTSQDRSLNTGKFISFAHLPGKSDKKNTKMVLETWSVFWNKLPTLTVIQDVHRMGTGQKNVDYHFGRMTEEEYRIVQNKHLFHICTSQVEGFGHYYWEALSCGAIPIILDAPPFNEQSEDISIKIAAFEKGRQNMLPLWSFKPENLVKSCEIALGMIENEIIRRSQGARMLWKQNNDYFFSRIKEAILSI